MKKRRGAQQHNWVGVFGPGFLLIYMDVLRKRRAQLLNEWFQDILPWQAPLRHGTAVANMLLGNWPRHYQQKDI
jgi:hypothetical protein